MGSGCCIGQWVLDFLSSLAEHIFGDSFIPTISDTDLFPSFTKTQITILNLIILFKRLVILFF